MMKKMIDLRNELSIYIADNYGECDNAPNCECLKTGWIGGSLCPSFKPFVYTTYEDMIMDARTIREKLIKEENG